MGARATTDILLNKRRAIGVALPEASDGVVARNSSERVPMAAESIDRHSHYPGPVTGSGRADDGGSFNHVTRARSLFQRLSGFGDVAVGPPDEAREWFRRGRCGCAEPRQSGPAKQPSLSAARSRRGRHSRHRRLSSTRRPRGIGRTPGGCAVHPNLWALTPENSSLEGEWSERLTVPSLRERLKRALSTNSRSHSAIMRFASVSSGQRSTNRGTLCSVVLGKVDRCSRR